MKTKNYTIWKLTLTCLGLSCHVSWYGYGVCNCKIVTFPLQLQTHYVLETLNSNVFLFQVE